MALGSGVEGKGAPIVPMLGEEDDKVHHVEAQSMARGWRPGCTDSSGIARRRYSRVRWSSVVDGVADVEILGHGRGVYVVQLDEAEMMVAMAWSSAPLCGEGARPEWRRRRRPSGRGRPARYAVRKKDHGVKGMRGNMARKMGTVSGTGGH